MSVLEAIYVTLVASFVLVTIVLRLLVPALVARVARGRRREVLGRGIILAGHVIVLVATYAYAVGQFEASWYAALIPVAGAELGAYAFGPPLAARDGPA